MRSSYRQIPAFVVRDLHNKNVTKIKTRSISLDNYFSFNHGQIVYSAYETDPRWGWRDYSVIRLLDPATGEDRRLTRHSRYFAPDISPDGQRIVAVQEAADGSCALHLLDPSTGSLLSQIPNRDSLFYTYPKFYTENTIVTAVRNRRGQMSLAAVSIADGQPRYLLPFSWQTIAFPSISADTIYFTASRDGQDRPYALAAGRLFRVTLPHGDPLTGQYQLHAPPNGPITWNTFTAAGFHLDTAARNETTLQEIPVSDWRHDLPLQNIDSLSHGPAGLLNHIATANYPATRYPLGSHLINFHSWRPYINDPDYSFSLGQR
ncbi:TolB family protein [Puia sp. P3]|uniref:TolB family protein n=1 Tax=Puia sp. P3 TaxID=3423952 RepID=UPI003D66BDC5